MEVPKLSKNVPCDYKMIFCDSCHNKLSYQALLVSLSLSLSGTPRVIINPLVIVKIYFRNTNLLYSKISIMQFQFKLVYFQTMSLIKITKT